LPPDCWLIVLEDGAGRLPISLCGTPVSRHRFDKLPGVFDAAWLIRLPWQGSTARLATPVTTGANNSFTFGARVAFCTMPRNRSDCSGAHSAPAFQLP
jgi:hypothetical protein